MRDVKLLMLARAGPETVVRDKVSWGLGQLGTNLVYLRALAVALADV